MNNKIRVFFEFRLPLISYLLLFIIILVLFLFNVSFPLLGSKLSQVGIILLFFGFGIRILSSITVKYLGKIKITGIYTLCRHPMLLGQFISFIGLNLMICNFYFTFFSILVFIFNDVLSAKKYDKILAHQYRDIWGIYSKSTNFILPFTTRIRDLFVQSLSTHEVENSHNTPIFLMIYFIMIEIATFNNM